jgi:hypothetical protein
MAGEKTENPSLPPIVLFRRRLKSFSEVLYNKLPSFLQTIIHYNNLKQRRVIILKKPPVIRRAKKVKNIFFNLSL